METKTTVRSLFPEFAPYDPANSPGPIPSVIERFRPRPYQPGEEDPDGPEAAMRRYTVVLVTPEHAEALGHDRSDAGLKLYVDDEWEADPPDLYQAASCIADECDHPVTLVEHTSDLTYWTAHPRT